MVLVPKEYILVGTSNFLAVNGNEGNGAMKEWIPNFAEQNMDRISITEVLIEGFQKHVPSW